MSDISERFGLNYLVRKPPAPSYTLTELTTLCMEYALEMENSEEGRQDINLRLTMSSLLAWLAKREQGEESNNVDQKNQGR